MLNAFRKGLAAIGIGRTGNERPWRSYGQYERWVRDLVRTHPLDEAMSIAVGGRYEEVGAIERDILRWAGLRDGMRLVDVGCGSGRLAAALRQTGKVDYTGLDAIEPLLDYCRQKFPEYRFVHSTAMTLPFDDGSVDVVSAFAVLSHMLHSEAYLYLQDMFRVLRPGGAVVMSFTEFAEPSHWVNFSAEIESHKTSLFLHTSIERSALDVWCTHLGFQRESFVGANEAPWGGIPLGQSVAVLRKPG